MCEDRESEFVEELSLLTGGEGLHQAWERLLPVVSARLIKRCFVDDWERLRPEVCDEEVLALSELCLLLDLNHGNWSRLFLPDLNHGNWSRWFIFG